MSIGVEVSDKGTPAECYVLDRSNMVTLPEYLHTQRQIGICPYFSQSKETENICLLFYSL